MNKCLLLLVVFTSLVSQTLGLSDTQQLRFINNELNYSLNFTGATADLSDFGPLLAKFNRVCGNGAWSFYTKADFDGSSDDFASYVPFRNVCQDIEPSKYKSIRHWGHVDTNVDAISLYSGTHFRNETILVTLRAKTDITMPVASVAAIGYSSWMLFDGPGLNGKSTCFVPNQGLFYGYIKNVASIQTVRSVFRGCDLEEIAAYKKMNSL